MTTTNEFKFNCPACGQRIQVPKEWSHRWIECPACKEPVVVPPPPKPLPQKAPERHRPPPSPKGAEGPASAPSPKEPVAPPTRGVPQPAVTKAPERHRPSPPPKEAEGSASAQLPKESVAPPARPAPQPAAPAPPAAGSPPKPVPSAKISPPPAAPKSPSTLRVAVLTPTIKLDMVRAVRRRIADESAWLPGKIQGANAYAAKRGGTEDVLVEVTSPEATRFSLIGAFELEFHLRNVLTTATGRIELLDEEIPEAVRDVLQGELSPAAREQVEDASAETDVMSISHAQCLATLDWLEERYSSKQPSGRLASTASRVANIHLSELVKKLEAKEPIAAEVVARALCEELAEIRRRLDELEHQTLTSEKRD